MIGRIVLSLFALLFWAKGEETLLLNTQIKLIPKIMYLNEPKNSSLLLGIVYDDGRKGMAERIVSDINNYYKGFIGDKSLKVLALSVNELKKHPQLTFIYLIKMEDSSAIQTATWSLSNAVPAFSYDIENLDHGILGTIAIERNAVIYINKETLKAGRFQLNKSLLEMAKLI